MSIDAQEATRIQRAVDATHDMWNKRFSTIANDIALRKWCIEHAGAGQMTPVEVLRFLTAPIAEVLGSADKEQSS